MKKNILEAKQNKTNKVTDGCAWVIGWRCLEERHVKPCIMHHLKSPKQTRLTGKPKQQISMHAADKHACMHALFYTLLLMARGCLPFNGTQLWAPACQLAIRPSVSQCSLAYYSHLLYVSAREWQMGAVFFFSIATSSTSQQFFFWKNKTFCSDKFRRVFSVFLSGYVGSLTC